MPAVTLDLWHTLMYLRPEAEEEYMETQIRIAAEVLAESKRRPGAVAESDGELRRTFEQVYADAVSEAGRGRTVTPADQILRAGAIAGRWPRPEEYLHRLAEVVAGLPFERAPGALEFLQSLTNDGYRLGVISNTIGEPGAFLRPVLRAMGFDRFVDTFVFSDEHPWTKPAPEIFRATLRNLGESPGAAVHVGDGWSDVEGARRAGMRAGILYTGLQEYGARYRELFLPKEWNRPPTEHVADRFDEVLAMIHTLLPSAPQG